MKKVSTILFTCLLILALTACAGRPGSSTTQAGGQESTETIQTSSESTNTQATDGVSTPAASVEDVIAENGSTHENAEDYEWNQSDIIKITLEGDSIQTDGNGVVVDGSKATITSAGTYEISGNLENGQIIVDCQDDANVTLVLNGVNIHNEDSAALFVADAKEVVLVLAAKSENILTDGAEYLFDTADLNEPNATIFSTADLTIFGDGSLTVEGNYNDGIASKDGLIIASGAISVTSVDDGIRGKDYVVIKDGNITVDSKGDGLKSDNAEDATLGFIEIQSGTVQITSEADAIQAETDILISGGVFNLTTAGGSGHQISADASAKGLKAGVNINIDGGTFDINSADDAINTNGNIVVNAGDFTLASGDDGMHADKTLEINDGTLTVSDSYEGIESAVITINGGDLHIIASDDGINVAGGNDGSGMEMGPGFGGDIGGGGRPGRGRDPNQAGVPGQGAVPGQDAFTYSGDYYLYINGGTIYVDANGDGLDSNGAIEMTNGLVIVNGPTENMNGALDYNGTFNLNGGFFVAAGSAGMAMAAGQGSAQNSVLINFSSAIQAGELVRIQNSSGEDILTFAATKTIQSITFSTANLLQGSYQIYVGGSSSGTEMDGLFQGGTYTPGDLYGEFDVTGTVTQVGSRSRF